MLNARKLITGAAVLMQVLLYGCGEQESTPAPAVPGASVAPESPVAVARRPNILLIVADDLGYSDLGVYGSEIPTPNLDQLARDGVIMTSFYSGLTCSPTRSMLLSGTDNHLAGLGIMAPSQQAPFKDRPGYEGHMNFRVASLANLLQDAGYHTYMTGKWHLGFTEETGPAARGFERSFVSLDGAAHLGTYAWNGPGTDRYRDGARLTSVGEDFYSSRFYAETMMDYIEDGRGDGKPFFAYLAFTAPHWPLQAPDASIARFHGRYDEGYDVLYQERLRGLRATGFIPEDNTGTPRLASEPPWEELSDEERKVEARKMEIYAAMVGDLDFYIGKVIDYLKSIDQFDNTFILFLSDNGAESRRTGAWIQEWMDQCCDTSYGNMGRGDSYIMYGPNWARASAAPFRRYKATGFEGGIHVPAFAHYPGLARAGVRANGIATVMDVLPTFLELAGAEHPGNTYRGREILPVKGKSLLPLLLGEREEIHDPGEFQGWELYGHRAVRNGDWKIVWDGAAGEDAAWQLFNLREDISEQRDLAAGQPEKLAELITQWEAYREQNGLP